MMEQKLWKQWVNRWCIINLSIVVIVGFSSMIIMKALNEDYSNEEIVTSYSDVLYGSAIKENSTIKFDIIKLKQPDVVAIGSSRVMQFRSDYFYNNNFYTMGGTAGSVSEAQETFDRIKRIYVPEVIILGIDLWWLNPRFDHENYLEKNELIQTQKYESYFQLWSVLMKNENLRNQLLELDKLKEYDDYGHRKNIGLTASVKSEGYRLSDGSYQYGKIIKERPSVNEKFQDTYDRLNKGIKRFEWTDEIDKCELDKLTNLIADMKVQGCHVIVFLPPFPNEIYREMEQSEHYKCFLHDFETSIQKQCLDLQIVFFDFSNLAWIKAEDDESIDGFHGSDLAYARIIREMLKDDILRKYVDEDYLDYLIQNPISNVQVAL